MIDGYIVKPQRKAYSAKYDCEDRVSNRVWRLEI